MVEDYSDLVQICLVSRRFRDLAQPFLFRKFDDLAITGLLKTLNFAATLSRRPDLAKCVQDIYIAPNDIVPGNLRLQAGDKASQTIAQLKLVVKSLQLGDVEEQRWCSSIHEVDVGVIVALLLSMAPNLRALRLPGGCFSYSPFNLLLGRDPSYLSNLEVLWIECEKDSRAYEISEFERFLTLPSLKSPTFERGNLSSVSFPSTWKTKSLNAEELAFSRCHIEANTLSKLIKACKG